MNAHFIKRNLFWLIFGLLFFSFILFMRASQPVAQAAGAAKLELPATEELLVSLQPHALQIGPGESLGLDLTLTNRSGREIGPLQVFLPGQAGLTFLAGPQGPLAESGQLAFTVKQLAPLETAVSSLVIGLDGLPAEPLQLTALVTGSGRAAVRAAVEIDVRRPAAQRWSLPPDGGQLTDDDGRLQLNLPAGWSGQAAEVQLQWLAWNDGTRSIDPPLHFQLTAATGAGEALAQPTVPLALGLNLPPGDWIVARRISGAWQPLASEYDPVAGVLSFSSDRFGEFRIGSGNPQEAWLPAYNPPGAAEFSGAAHFSYPLSLPPAIGRFQPELTFAYGSRGLDARATPLQAFGPGLGWSLTQTEIRNGMLSAMYNPHDPDCDLGCKAYSNRHFDLILAGKSYRLEPEAGVSRHGRYRALGDPGLRIELLADLNSPNRSGEYWLIQTADGTTLRLGYNDDSELAVGPVANVQNQAQPRHRSFSAFSWKVDQVLDSRGHEVRFSYDEACGQYRPDPSLCRREDNYPALPSQEHRMVEVDHALRQIAYNFVAGQPQTVIEIENSLHNYDLRQQFDVMRVGVLRPETVTVFQAGAVVSAYELSFDQEMDIHFNGAMDISYWHWWLTDITAYGLDGASGEAFFPAIRFFYEQDTAEEATRLLTRVENGYGAVTQMLYQPLSHEGDTYFYVQQIDAWDGVNSVWAIDPPARRIVYQFDESQACYDEEGSGCEAPRYYSEYASGSLVGFAEVEIQNQDGQGALLGRRWQQFNVSSYPLHGRLLDSRRLDETGQILDRTTSSWEWNGRQARLARRDLYRHDPQAGETLHTFQTYLYDPLYGALMQQTEYDEQGQPYRCEVYEYAHQVGGGSWLVNRPVRQATLEGSCSGPVLTETLWRYEASQTPAEIGLAGYGDVQWTLHWAGDDNYSTGRTLYHQNGFQAGLPQQVDSYFDYSKPDSYAEQLRSSLLTPVYNIAGRPLQQTLSAAGLPDQLTSWSYEAQRPWLTTGQTASQGSQSAYEYDALGRLLRVWGPDPQSGAPTVEKAAFSYQLIDPPAAEVALVLQVDEVTTPGDPLAVTRRRFYDGFGQLLQERTFDLALADGQSTIWRHWQYDALGRQLCETAPQTAESTTFWPKVCTDHAHTATQFDAAGRMAQQTLPDSSVTAYTYGLFGPWAELLPAGVRHDRRVNARGDETLFAYDAFDRLVWVAQEQPPAGCVDGWQITEYEYDSLDRLLRVRRGGLVCDGVYTPGGVETVTTYDALGNKVSLSDPDTGLWRYEYDSAGKLIRQEDERGAVVCSYYDSLSRLRHRALAAAGSCPTQPPLDGPDHLAAYSYDDGGQLTAIAWGADPAADWESWQYDLAGRSTMHRRSIQGSLYELQVVAFDGRDRPLQVLYPDGEIVDYSYDSAGQTGLAASGDEIFGDAMYDGLGRLISFTRGNGLETAFIYGGGSDNFRLLEIHHGTEDDSLPDFQYEYDILGQITTLTTSYSGQQDVQSFSYDALGRLQTAAGSGALPAYGYEYGYDLLGNLVEKRESGAHCSPDCQRWNFHVAAGGAPHAVQSVSRRPIDPPLDEELVYDFTYDDAGNMIARQDYLSGSQFAQQYDAQARLVQIEHNGQITATFGYDAGGQRTWQLTADGELTHYPFADYEVRRQDGLQSVRQLYAAAGRLVARHEERQLVNANFENGTAGQWEPWNGIWQLVNVNESQNQFAYRQFSTNVQESTSSYSVTQSGTMYYTWQMALDTGQQRAAFYFGRSTGEAAGDGSAYFVRQDGDLLELGRQERGRVRILASANAPLHDGKMHHYEVDWDSTASRLTIRRDDQQLLQVVDRSPLTEGRYIGLWTQGSGATFDNILVIQEQLTYFFNDHLGSSQIATGADGQPLDGSRTAYLPFGDYRQEPAAGLQPLGFTGHRQHDGLGLVYMNARYYLPAIGRFASADTLVPDPADPQSFNRYAYLENNPLHQTDSSGHCADDDPVCWAYLEDEFCIDLDCGDDGWQTWVYYSRRSGFPGVWTRDELLQLHNALLETKEALDEIGIDWLETDLQGVRFKRVHADETSEGANAHYLRFKHMIYLGNQAFGSSNYLIHHELGHAIDESTLGMDLHQRYADIAGGYWGDFLWRHWYPAEGTYYRDRSSGGRHSQLESWADAFAAWVHLSQPGASNPNWADAGLQMTDQNWQDMFDAVTTSLLDEY